MMVLTASSARTAWVKTLPTMPVATSPSTARRPACAAASPSADALTTAALALLAARLLGSTPCERPVMDAMACAISARGGLGWLVCASPVEQSRAGVAAWQKKIYETDVVAPPAAVTLSDWISWRPVCARHVAA